MGLDIYFHKTNLRYEGAATDQKSFSAFRDEVDKDAQKKLRAYIDKNLKPLKEAWKEMQTNKYWESIYNERYFSFVVKLREIIAYPYEFRIYPYTKNVLPLNELEELLNKEVDMWYKQYDAYFRKVNFIFAYFENNGSMVDEYYAITDKETIEELINRCEKVLANHELAQDLLPTQNGFFFGSTSYDKWYFYDVKDCLKQMKKFVKGLTDEMTAYVIFSW